MNKRHIDLVKLGFTLDGESYYLYKWGNQYWADLMDIPEYSNTDWKYYIESIKEDLKSAEITYKSDDMFIAGANSAEKQIKQKLLDLKNKYKSELREETYSKMGKRSPNFKRTTELIAKIELLIEIENKI